MNKENNIVYVQTKRGIFKCYKSEQMHKPIYYPVESKTNGYIDYYDVIRILNIDDLYEQFQKQKEIIDKAKSLNHEISHTIYEDFLEENIIGSKFLYERIKKQLSTLEDKGM